ncbi:MAG: alkaline phosphatase family protein, partial [Nitrososphaerales archaeon]
LKMSGGVEYQSPSSGNTTYVAFGLPTNGSWVMMCDEIMGATTTQTSSSSSSSSTTTTTTTTSSSSTPHTNGTISHFITIFGENTAYAKVTPTGAPYQTKLANDYTLLSNYYAGGSLSLPNYLLVTSGSNWGTPASCDKLGTNSGCVVNGSDVSSLLKGAPYSWKEYAESMPSPCYNANTSLYAVKHNPFMYYEDVVGNQSYCDSHVVPMNMTTGEGFLNDLNNGNLPTYSFITPNICDDGHNLCGNASSGVSEFDHWLSNLIPQIQGSPEWNSTAILITYDESGSSTSEQVFAVLVSSLARNNYTDSSYYTHSSALLTAEQVLGIGYLGRNDSVANSFCSDLYLSNPCSHQTSINVGQSYTNTFAHSIILRLSVSGSGDLFFSLSGQSILAIPLSSSATTITFVLQVGDTYSFGSSSGSSVSIDGAEVLS